MKFTLEERNELRKKLDKWQADFDAWQRVGHGAIKCYHYGADRMREGLQLGVQALDRIQELEHELLTIRAQAPAPQGEPKGWMVPAGAGYAWVCNVCMRLANASLRAKATPCDAVDDEDVIRCLSCNKPAPRVILKILI